MERYRIKITIPRVHLFAPMCGASSPTKKVPISPWTKIHRRIARPAISNSGDLAIPTPGRFPFPSGEHARRCGRIFTVGGGRARERSMLFLSCIKEKRRSAGNRNTSGSASERTPDWTTHRTRARVSSDRIGSVDRQREAQPG